MPGANPTTSSLADFFDQEGPYVEATATTTTVSYLAIQDGEDAFLLKARIFLAPTRRTIPLCKIETRNVRAGHFLLSDLNVDARRVVEALLENQKLPTPSTHIRLRANDMGDLAVTHVTHHPEGLREYNRLSALTVMGGQCFRRTRWPALDWELKAANPPYDSLGELASVLQLGLFDPDAAALEVLSQNVAVFDYRSAIAGKDATLKIRLGSRLNTELAAVGYRTFVQGAVVHRGYVSGCAMTWSPDGDWQAGSAVVQCPPGALLRCIVSYAGVAQHEGWAADPTTVQNSFRSVFETVDPGLTDLRRLLGRSGDGGDARRFETGVAWLLALHGFRVVHFGRNDRTQGAFDIIATTPMGAFVLVECTTGVLKADKIALLIARTEAVRRKLRNSGVAEPRVLPAIVTVFPRSDVESVARLAEDQGVVVICAEDLRRAVDRSVVFSDPDALFAEAEQAIAGRQASVEASASATT